MQDQRGSHGVYRRAGRNVNTPLRTVLLQISQVIEKHLKKSEKAHKHSKSTNISYNISKNEVN